MKSMFWFALSILNAVGIVLNVFAKGHLDIEIVILQAFSAIFCLAYGFREVKE